MKYIYKILIVIFVIAFLPILSCEDDAAFVEQKPSITLIAPEDMIGDVDVTPPTFVWEASDPNGRPLKYDFYLGVDSTRLFLQAQNLKETSYNLEDYKLKKDGDYYWQVIAKNGIEQSKSDIWRFRSIPAPNPAVLISPENDSYVRESLTFEWEEVPAGEGETIIYNVFLSRSDKFEASDIIGTVDDGSTSLTIDQSNLEIGATYYWKVDASDLINSSSSEVRSFIKLRPGAPDVPQLIAPANKSGAMLGIVLDWSDVADPEGDTVSYDVYLDNQNQPATLVATVTDSQFTTSGLVVNSAYYWYVVAKDPAGNATESEIFGFSSIGNSPGFPMIHDFQVADVYSLDEILTWDAATGATSYDVYVDTANPPVNLVASNLTTTQYEIKNEDIPSDLLNVKTYYVMVVAKDGVGGQTNSFPVAFTPQMTGVYTDVRGSESLNYTWVRLGTQVWMSQNLRTKKLTNGEDLIYWGPRPLTIDPSSDELYFDDHDLPVAGFPDVWSDGDNGRVYSNKVPANPLIAPEGWHVLNLSDISILQSYIPNAGNLLDEWYGGDDPYEANFVMAGYRYDTFDPGRPYGFRYDVEKGRVTFWMLGDPNNNAWELYPNRFRRFFQGNPHTRMFGIRLVKN